MLVEQFYTSCLSQASYYIESNGEAAVIDPSRETNHFIEKANKIKTCPKNITSKGTKSNKSFKIQNKKFKETDSNKQEMKE